MKSRSLLPLLLMMLSAGIAHAHNDPNKVIFVASDGVDAGQCNDAAAPCKTIDYAIRWVGKGGQIRFAGGPFEVTSADNMFQLVSDAVDARGGFKRDDGYSSATAFGTTLLGVPAKYAATLREKGFHIINDGKSLKNSIAAATDEMLLLNQATKANAAFSPCVGGLAGSFECDKVDLLSHIGLGASVSGNPQFGADVWGFVDLNSGREYAIIGYDVGTAIFDVTDAENPKELAFIDGQRTSWRDIKIFQKWNETDVRFDAFAYITTDGSTDGLFVIDLRGLPQSVARLPFDFSSEFFAAHNVFATNADYGTGLTINGDTPNLVVAGSDNDDDARTDVDGLFRIYSLADPTAPQFIGARPIPVNPSLDPGYMHDAASMIVTDNRRTQCAGATSYCEVLFDFNETSTDLWNITDPNNLELLSSIPSPIPVSNPQGQLPTYVHSGWPTEDGQFLFMHDELDEISGNRNATTVRILSLADLRAPVMLPEWSGPEAAIDHNGFVRGNRYYMSNYRRGFTVLDITNPAGPIEEGFIDTFPNLNDVGFNGAWGVYPFFHSGNIAVSDINRGLFMVADRTLDRPEGKIVFAERSFGGEESATPLQISVDRLGGSTGNVSVQYEILPVTGDATDVAGGSGVLNWADGDGVSKNIELTLVDDGDGTEVLERLLIKLISPTGGATLGAASVASVYISEPGATAVVDFSTSDLRATERGFATAVVVLRRTGSAVGAASVDYAVTNGDATAGVDFTGISNGTIDWAAGDADPKSIEFAIVDDGEDESSEFVEFTLSNAMGSSLGANTTLRMEIANGTGVNTAPNAIAGINQVVDGGSVVTLDGSQSNDPENDALTYQWAQIAGTTVAINNAMSAQASFTAPSPNSDALLRFELTVMDSSGLSDTSSVQITVSKVGGGNKGGGGGSASWLLLLACLTRLRPLLQATRRDAV